MKMEIKCPNCNEVLHPNTAPCCFIIDTRTLGEGISDVLVIEMRVDFECNCGCEITLKDALQYKLNGKYQ